MATNNIFWHILVSWGKCFCANSVELATVRSLEEEHLDLDYPTIKQ